MKKWFKNHKKLTRWMIGIGIFTLIIALYWITYWAFTSWRLLPAGENLGKSDWLAFWGSFVGFAGSLILGMVAIFQNIKQREDNEKSENRMAELTRQANEIAERQMMLEYTPKIIFDRNCEIKFNLSQPKINYLDEMLHIEAYNKNKNELGSTSNQIKLTTKIRSINNAIITEIGFSNMRIKKQSVGEIDLMCSEGYSYLIENNEQQKVAISVYLQNIYDVIRTSTQNDEMINGLIQVDADLIMKNIYGKTSKTPLTIFISWQMYKEEFEDNNLYDKAFTGYLTTIYREEKNNG